MGKHDTDSSDTDSDSSSEHSGKHHHHKHEHVHKHHDCNSDSDSDCSKKSCNDNKSNDCVKVKPCCLPTFAQYCQLCVQPPVGPGQPFTYTIPAIISPNITAITAIFNPPFTASGTVFILANIGFYEVNWQMTYPSDGGVVLYQGPTIPTMYAVPYAMIGKISDGQVAGSVIIQTTTVNSYVSINAAAGNTTAIVIPPNSSSTNLAATTVSFKQIC